MLYDYEIVRKMTIHPVGKDESLNFYFYDQKIWKKFIIIGKNCSRKNFAKVSLIILLNLYKYAKIFSPFFAFLYRKIAFERD